ncbi:MAG: membrane protein insertase YidC [Proteobacteria bacterium]|nr:MAG: membrane protein insertase YidC [Pseudomonadota bacterium]
METQRLILYVALGLVLMLLWQSWIEYTTPTRPVGETTVSATTGEGRESDVANVPEAPDTPGQAAAPATEALPSTGSARTVTVETDLLRVEISTVGADIRKVELKNYPVDVDHPDQALPLMTPNQPNVFISETGLLGRGHAFPNHRTEWSVDGDQFTLADGADAVEVVFRWFEDSGLTYRKTYRFVRDSYLIDYRYEIDNGTDIDWSGFQYAQFARTEVQEEGSMGFLGRLPSYKGAAIYTSENRFEKVSFPDMRDGDLSRRVDDGWVSMLQQYFVGAWLPPTDEPLEFYSSVSDSTVSPLYRIGFKTLTPVEVAPGTTGTIENTLYIGPTEQDRLEVAAEGLVLSVDYGWLTAIASPLFWLLNNIHKLIGNWGWSIIFLTILIKLVFFPLSAASYRSMAKMKNLQPRLKTLKERYGDDRQKFQAEMMKIYKEEKINPLGGCLPILVQIPVFIALYWVLLESVELRQATWFWLDDLSIKDPFYVLPVLMGVSMVVQQRLNPAPMDDIQKKVMMALPVVFTVFFLFFPAGLVLYWVVNNVLSIAQQWFITNKLQAKS